MRFGYHVDAKDRTDVDCMLGEEESCKEAKRDSLMVSLAAG